MVPHLSATPKKKTHQIPEVDLQNASPDDFQKPKWNPGKNKSSELGNHWLGETNSKFKLWWCTY